MTFESRKERVVNGKRVIVVTETEIGRSYVTTWKSYYFTDDWSAVTIVETRYPNKPYLDSHHSMVRRKETISEMHWGHNK